MCISQIQVSLSLSCILSPWFISSYYVSSDLPTPNPRKKGKTWPKTTASLHPFEAPPPHLSSCSGVPVNSQQTPSGPSAGSPDRSTPQSLPAPRCATSPGRCFGATPGRSLPQWKCVLPKNSPNTCNMTSLRHHPITESHGIQWFQCYTVFSRVCWACRRWKIWSRWYGKKWCAWHSSCSMGSFGSKVSIFFSSSWLMGKI